jgi:hypothetical protein
MRLRFLQTTSSASPGFPFQAGQIIAVPRLTSEHKRWIASGHAELVKEPSETAVAVDAERAVTEEPRKRARG